MKLTFRGWDREVLQHEHTICNVVRGKGTYAEQPKSSVKWTGPMSAQGKISGVSLTGAFLVTFEFKQAELKSWLLKFAEAEPEAALRLIAEAQAEAIIALNGQPDN